MEKGWAWIQGNSRHGAGTLPCKGWELPDVESFPLAGQHSPQVLVKFELSTPFSRHLVLKNLLEIMALLGHKF